MSTRCTIAMKNDDGTLTAIYCHHDGYLSGVGKTLLNYYQDPRKVRQLMELGDISSLGVFPISETEYRKLISEDKITINTDANGMGGDYIACDDYNEGEKSEAVTYEDLNDYTERLAGTDRDYLYYFDGEEWFYAPKGERAFKRV